MDVLEAVKWVGIIVILILYTIFFFELCDQYFYHSMKGAILAPIDNSSHASEEL